ncbi:MAG TPA: hypothetical protein P5328_02325 [Candidatus Paceibacterota bacterium]|nr:hypothetical protein [Candidatus Paceibacterota bacterium]HRZ34411.1 hypothetical protein [Candidatus Paceibacterota bacterium]
MDTNPKDNINKILNTIPIVIGVVVAVVALLGIGSIQVILAMLGIGLFSTALGELVS